MNESGERIPYYDCDCGFFAYYMKAVVNNKESNMIINYTKGYYEDTKFDAHIKDFLSFGNFELVKKYKSITYLNTRRAI